MITDTKIFTRKSAELPLWNLLDVTADHPLHGTKYTSTISEDGLYHTVVRTYDDFDTWSAIQNTLTLARNAENVIKSNARLVSFDYNGIFDPFILTRTYTFPDINAVGLATAKELLEVTSQAYKSLKSFTVTDSTVTVVEEFNDEYDYMANFRHDNRLAVSLSNVGCTRTYLYAAKT